MDRDDITIEELVRSLLDGRGRPFRVFDRRDSGCVSWDVDIDGKRRLVKYTSHDSRDARGFPVIEALQNAIGFHSAVSHAGIVPLLQHVDLPEGLALVYPWVDGEVLASPEWPDKRTNPASPYSRFQRLSPARKLDALDSIIDAHRAVVAAGYIAVDFYLGAIIYDFTRHRVWLIDFDHYHPGPYVLHADRQLGSRSLMAPEEFQRGALIDERTTLFTLGKMALEFLGDRRRVRTAWCGPQKAYDVIHRATAPDPAQRYPSFEHFYREWQASRAGG